MHRFAISAWKVRIDHLLWVDYLVIKVKQSCNFYYGPSMCFEKATIKKGLKFKQTSPFEAAYSVLDLNLQ